VLQIVRALLAEGRDAAVVELVQKLVSRNAELEKQLALFGGRRHKNEGISTAQLHLFLKAVGINPDEALRKADEALLGESRPPDLGAEKPAEDEAAPEPGPKRPPPVRRPIPPNLRRVENPILVPAAERACPCCQGERQSVAPEITEVIELIPAEVIVRVDKREKLVCPICEGQLARAPMGDKVVKGGAYGSMLVAQLLVGKYSDSLPLYRQAEQLERLGLKMSRSTMGDQITWATDLLEPLWRHSMDVVLKSYVMQLDGTGLPVLDKDHPKGIRLGALWGYVGDETTALYLYTSTAKKNGQRPGELGPEDMLMRRTGFAVADASNLFDQSFKRSDLIEVGCNMHARRGFIVALEAGDVRASMPIAAYKKLYDIEERIAALGPDEKRAVRQAESKPVFEALISWCEQYRLVEPPKSPLGQAVGYLLRHQTALTRFLEDGRLPIDNGLVERLHRRVGVGRRNYLFAGSDVGGRRAAIAYSILGTCRLLDIDPLAYLADVLPHLARSLLRPRDVGRLMPAEWKARQVGPPEATS
jgi:transposase